MAKHKAIYGKPVATGMGRLTFMHLASVDNSQYGGGNYNCTHLVPNDQAKKLNEKLREECLRVAKEAFPDILKSDADLAKIEWPWKNGDKKPEREGHAGHTYIMAKAYGKTKDGKLNSPPETKGPDGTSNVDPKVFYPGCLGCLKVTPSSYVIEDVVHIQKPDGSLEEKKITKHGIRLNLVSVQFCGDGERFKTGSRDTGFDPVEGPTTSSAAPASSDW